MIKTRLLLLSLSLFLLFNSCKHIESFFEKYHDGFDILIEYIESEKDYINGREVPFFIFAPEVYGNSDKYLIIDIRTSEDFKNGHIENSVNVQFPDLINYIENIINPLDYEKIVFVCNNGFHSGFATMGLMYLGYKNIYPLRNGLSSWNKQIADKYWFKGISSVLSDKLENTEKEKNEPADYPVLLTTKETGQEILRERIIEIFNGNINDYFVEITDIKDSTESYYIISYWDQSRYFRGHIPTSIHYIPKQSLKTGTYLSTLPTDKPVVIQCFTGDHAAFVTMFLRILGYDARDLMYGSNSFMYNILEATERPGGYFTDRMIFNFPLIKEGN